MSLRSTARAGPVPVNHLLKTVLHGTPGLLSGFVCCEGLINKKGNPDSVFKTAINGTPSRPWTIITKLHAKDKNLFD